MLVYCFQARALILDGNVFAFAKKVGDAGLYAICLLTICFHSIPIVGFFAATFRAASLLFIITALFLVELGIVSFLEGVPILIFVVFILQSTMNQICQTICMSHKL